MRKKRLAGAAALAMLISGLQMTGAAAQDAGDTNGDGSVNSSDAADVLIYAAEVGAGGTGALTDAQIQAADVDQNGEINASDAANILIYAAVIGSGGSTTLEEIAGVAPTEAPTEATGAFAYYDLLAQEYEAVGTAHPSASLAAGFWQYEGYYRNPSVCYHNKQVWFAACEEQEDASCLMLYSYDIASGKLHSTKIGSASQFQYSDIRYSGSKLAISQSENETFSGIYIMDVDDPTQVEVVSADALPWQYGEWNLLPSGHLISLYNSTGYPYYYSKETGAVQLPLLHDKLIDSPYALQYVGSWQNRIYVKASTLVDSTYEGYIHCFDLETMEWSDPKFIISDSTLAAYNTGRYLILSGDLQTQSIYDMEKDEMIATLSVNEGYYGGKAHISTGEGTFVRWQIPGDGSEPDASRKEIIGEYDELSESFNWNTVYPLNAAYYAFVDDRGIFLRTYEDGADGEKTIFLFPQE